MVVPTVEGGVCILTKMLLNSFMIMMVEYRFLILYFMARNSLLLIFMVSITIILNLLMMLKTNLNYFVCASDVIGGDLNIVLDALKVNHYLNPFAVNLL